MEGRLIPSLRVPSKTRLYLHAQCLVVGPTFQQGLAAGSRVPAIYRVLLGLCLPNSRSFLVGEQPNPLQHLHCKDKLSRPIPCSLGVSQALRIAEQPRLCLPHWVGHVVVEPSSLRSLAASLLVDQAVLAVNPISCSTHHRGAKRWLRYELSASISLLSLA